MSIELERIFDLPYYQLASYPLERCFTSKVNGKWVSISTQQFVDQSNEVSKGLLAMGVKPGDKVGIISNNRYEWHIMDMGILQIGAISVPIYSTISVSSYEYIFNHAELRMVFVSDISIFKKVSQVAQKNPSILGVYTFDLIEGARHWTDIKSHGGLMEQSKVNAMMDGVDGQDLATIIYTSGTTGKPKGVMLSHANIISNVLACGNRFPARFGHKALSFLPVCHIYERTLIYLYLKEGTSVYFAESLETIAENIKEIKPHIFSAVPRLLEKVFDSIMDKGQALSGIKRMLFFWAVAIGEHWEPYGQNGRVYKWKLSIVNKLIFSKWREALGGNVIAIASGSAALQPRLAKVFNAAKIPVFEGYGLTETSPVISVNELNNNGLMIGTVGRIIDHVSVGFMDDGEILCKGPNVMLGYYKDPEKTSQAITPDGWLHTGDIGEMVGENNDFLKITDRKKEMFKTSGGKYIAPQVMENMLKESRFIEQAMVIGENRKHPSVLVVPANDFVIGWCNRSNIKCYTAEQLVENEEVRARIWKDVVQITRHLGRWETPKKMYLCTQPWTIENDELTPT